MHACAASVLAATSELAGCGRTPSDAETSARPDADHNTVVDASRDGPESGGPRDAPEIQRTCTEPFRSIALSPPEVLVSGRSRPEFVGVSSHGVVWIETVSADPPHLAKLSVFLRALPEPILLVTEGDAVSGVVFLPLVFSAAGGHFAYLSQAYWDRSGGWFVTWGSTTGEVLGSFNVVGASGISGFALDESHFYFQDGVVFRRALSDPYTPPEALEWSENLHLVAVDAHWLYAVSEAPPLLTFHRVPKSGGSSQVLADADDSLAGRVFAHDGTLFWIRYKVGSIRPDLIQILTEQANAWRTLVDDPDGVGIYNKGASGLAVDCNYVYWVSGDSRIMRIPREGGDPEVVADNQDYPADVAVDDTAVYWVNAGVPSYSDGGVAPEPVTGSVMRVRKE